MFNCSNSGVSIKLVTHTDNDVLRSNNGFPETIPSIVGFGGVRRS